VEGDMDTITFIVMYGSNNVSLSSFLRNLGNEMIVVSQTVAAIV
jgi:hypothetical protein